MSRIIPYYEVAKIAYRIGATEVFWRESQRSYTGFVAEIWFNYFPESFRKNCETVLNHFVAVRKLDDEVDGPAPYVMSVPVAVPDGQITLGYPSRGSRLKLEPQLDNVTFADFESCADDLVYIKKLKTHGVIVGRSHNRQKFLVEYFSSYKLTEGIFDQDQLEFMI